MNARELGEAARRLLRDRPEADLREIAREVLGVDVNGLKPLDRAVLLSALNDAWRRQDGVWDREGVGARRA